MGALGGAAVGMLLGVAAGSDKPQGLMSFSRAEAGEMLGVVGAGLGAVIGGAVFGGERWEVVKLDKLKVGLAPNRQGPGVSVAVGF